MKRSEKLFEFFVYLSAISVVLALLGIVFSVFGEGLKLFRHIGFFEFVFNTQWRPTAENPNFGIGAIIVGSLAVTAGAMVVAVPLGLGSGVYLSEFAGARFRELVKPTIELLAGIPSVVYGLFGMVVLSPWVQRYLGASIGLNLFTTSVILGLMVVPIICSVSEDALSVVPLSLKEASLGLGANRWETTMRVVLPAAKSGVMKSLVLGLGRAVGETMVVVMLAGGAAIIPTSFFSPVRPMPATVAMEMGETVIGSVHYYALFAISMLLFAVCFCLVMVSHYLTKSGEEI